MTIRQSVDFVLLMLWFIVITNTGYTADLEPRFKSEATLFFTEITNMNWYDSKKDKSNELEETGAVTEKVGEKVGEKLTDNQKKIISLIGADSYISAKLLSENIGISVRKIETNISKLRKMGIICRVGPAKGGHWKITGKTGKY